MAVRQRTVAIRQWIIDRLEEHPKDIVRATADSWGITSEAARLHIKALENENVIVAEGQTSARRRRLNVLFKDIRRFQTVGLREDLVWSGLKPELKGLSENVSTICGIAVTEIVNNAVDHSESPDLILSVTYTAAIVDICIRDHGVGIFRKIREACNLAEDREAILELSKGKLTTAPAEHSGYGIYFTSRMMDVFQIHSGHLMFSHEQPDDDWLIEPENPVELKGTFVRMMIATSATRTANEVYNRFCGSPSAEHDAGFSRTHVPVSLAQYGNEKLVSRSQAKRVLARFEKFREVMLDFRGVEFIGQAFADEIFRVFPSQHPDVKLAHVNAQGEVLQMIQLAQATTHPRQRTLFTDNET